MINASHVRVTTGTRRYQPALDSNFAADRSLASRIGYPWTLTRASKAWDWDATPELQEHAINAARFPYSLTDGSSLGLRIEEQRTNLVANASGHLSGYSTGGVATTSVIVEDTPFGTEFIRATFPVGSSGFTDRFQSSLYSCTTGLAYSSFVWVRNIGVDLSVIHTNVGGSLAPTGRTIGDWVEYALENRSSSNTSASARLSIYATGTLASEQTVDIAIGQTVQAAYSTTPVIGAANTVRSADVCSIGGSNLTALYHPSQGTVVFEGVIDGGPTAFNIPAWTFYWSSASSFLGMYANGSQWTSRVGTGSQLITTHAESGFAFGQPCKLALTWGPSGSRMAINGVLSSVGAAGTISTPTTLRLMASSIYGPNTGYVSRFHYYREEMPSRLQELTTL